MAVTFQFGSRNERRNAAIAGALAALASGREAALSQVDLADIDPLIADALRAVDARVRNMEEQERAFVAQLEWMQQRHHEGWIYDTIDQKQFAGSLARATTLVNEIVRAHIDVKMQVVDVIKAYAVEDFDVSMERLPGEKAKITAAMDDVRDRLRASRDARKEMLRVKTALDNVTTNAMIADETNTVIYLNSAMTALFKRVEADIRKDLPQFRADAVVGSQIDEFHHNPAQQRAALADLRGTHREQIELGGRTFLLFANAILGADGTRFGTVMEWTDRTDEVKAERETEHIVRAAAAGDFTQRLTVEGRDGFFRLLAEQMNALLETSERGLSDVVRVLSAMAKGDLTARIDGNYSGTFGRLRDDSNMTVSSLTELIVKIREAVDQVMSAAREIATGNSDLSQRTEQQAASLEETAASMEELTATVQQNAEHARQANDLAIGAREIATKGGAVVNEVVTTMASINESAKKIVDIISVIDGIAFQTNILALNAAVEAARAGEQGRGFAVVAGEVRSLAQRSAAAAKEIKGLIGDSVEKTSAGSRLVDQAGQTMGEIVEAVRRVTEIMSEIAAASGEQKMGIEQVNRAVAQMESVTQQNAALVEEAAASASALEQQASNLVSSISVFRVADATHTSSARLSSTGDANGHHAPSIANGHAARVALPTAEDEDDWKAF